jgi:hypothetical protein
MLKYLMTLSWCFDGRRSAGIVGSNQTILICIDSAMSMAMPHQKEIQSGTLASGHM